MTNLVAITFDEEASAGEALRRLRQIEKEGQIRLADTAILVKDQEGKIHAKNELDSAVETGAVVGGFLGAALTFVFPVAGLVAGAAGGALVGRMFEQGVDKELVKEVREQLKPGTSALFLMVHEANVRAAIAAVEPFSGQVYQSSLSTEVEDELKKALQRRE